MVYRGKTLIASGVPAFDGRAVDGIEYMTREKFMSITPDRNRYYYVIEQRLPEILGAIAAGASAGTKFTAAYLPHGASALMSLLQTAAAVAADPTIVPIWGDLGIVVNKDAYTSGADIAAAAIGDVLTIYAVNAAGQVFGMWQKTLVEANIKA